MVCMFVQHRTWLRKVYVWEALFSFCSRLHTICKPQQNLDKMKVLLKKIVSSWTYMKTILHTIHWSSKVSCLRRTFSVCTKNPFEFVMETARLMKQDEPSVAKKKTYRKTLPNTFLSPNGQFPNTFYRNGWILKDISQKPTAKRIFPESVFHDFFHDFFHFSQIFSFFRTFFHFFIFSSFLRIFSCFHGFFFSFFHVFFFTFTIFFFVFSWFSFFFSWFFLFFYELD